MLHHMHATKTKSSMTAQDVALPLFDVCLYKALGFLCLFLVSLLPLSLPRLSASSFVSSLCSLPVMAPSLVHDDTPVYFDNKTTNFLPFVLWLIFALFILLIFVLLYFYIKGMLAAAPPFRQLTAPTQPQGDAVPLPVVVVPPRLDPDVVEDFERTEVQPNEEGSNDECFCFEEFVDGEAVVVPPCCRHRFHPICLRTWIATGSLECPFCQKDMGKGGGGGGGGGNSGSGPDSGC